MISLERRNTPQSDAVCAPAIMDPPLPEIRQLYCLIILTLRSHTDDSSAEESSTDVRCQRCHEPWPCAAVCRACDLLEVI
jgi:hypothetical protein